MEENGVDYDKGEKGSNGNGGEGKWNRRTYEGMKEDMRRRVNGKGRRKQ